MKPIIEVSNISKKYQTGIYNPYQTLRETIETLVKKGIEKEKLKKNEFWALKNVSFSVNSGEIIGIIGRNGAGKSTLLKILSRITLPSSGQAVLRGRVASLLEVGTGFHFELTGRENIFLNGSILGMKRKEIRNKFDEIVDFAGIDKFIDTPVKRYSSGMYMRLAFAVAANLESEILLVDEVLAVGDFEFQKKCLGKMRDVVKGGRTILFVSHNMAAITDLCDRAVLMKNGQIEKTGDVRKIVDCYLSAGKNLNPVVFNQENHSSPKKHVIIQRLSVKNVSEIFTSSFIMGETILVEIKVRCIKSITNVEIGLKISSNAGVAIHYFVSSWEGLIINMMANRTYVFKVEIPQIMLLPGRYILGVWVSKDGEWSDDNVQSAMSLEILSEDITGNIKKLGIKNNFNKYSTSGCASYLYSQWKVDEQGK